LTKTFEEYRRGLPAEVLAHFQKHPPKGEITLVISADGKKRKADVEDREA
jgi:16S rRNA (cytidine1402-2'-O)-methyltransferase